MSQEFLLCGIDLLVFFRSQIDQFFDKRVISVSEYSAPGPVIFFIQENGAHIQFLEFWEVIRECLAIEDEGTRGYSAPYLVKPAWCKSCVFKRIGERFEVVIDFVTFGIGDRVVLSYLLFLAPGDESFDTGITIRCIIYGEWNMRKGKEGADLIGKSFSGFVGIAYKVMNRETKGAITKVYSLIYVLSFIYIQSAGSGKEIVRSTGSQ